MREHAHPARRFCRHRFTVRSQKGRLKIQTARDCTPFGKQIPPDGFQTASEADIKELKNAFCLSKGFSSKCRPPHFPQSGGFGGSTSETTGEPFTLPQSRQTHPIGVFGLNAISIPILHKRIKRPPPIAGGMKLHHLQNFRQQSGKDIA